VLTRRGRYQVVSDNLRVKEAVVGDGGAADALYPVLQPARGERQRQHRQQGRGRAGAELASHRGAQRTAQWAIELRPPKRYGKYLRITSKGTLELDRAAESKRQPHT